MAATKAAQRRAAAEEVCWTLMLMLSFELLELPRKSRDMLAGPLQKWADLAVATDEMKGEDAGERDA